jgi:mono/diheme cytochrome c family protein
MKRTLIFIQTFVISIVAIQCGSNTQNASTANSAVSDSTVQKVDKDTVIVFLGINSKGIGRFKDIPLTHPLNEEMATKGKAIFESKCFACHKLSTEMLVGPGWSGVTKRRSPAWIMNWITNTKVMIDRDLAAQADMAVCLIRMPNQDLTDEQARNVLEFMRKNDGEK